jgi:hypothetical protein
MSQRPPPSLLRALSAHRPGRGKLYAASTQAQVVAFALGRRAEGASWNQISSEVGIRFETLRRWLERAPTMRTVEIIPDASRGTSVAVVSPSGHRLEGLTLDEAIAALRALG